VVEKQGEDTVLGEVRELSNQKMKGCKDVGREVDVQGLEKLRQEPARNGTAISPGGKHGNRPRPRRRDNPRQNHAGLQIDGTSELRRVSQASNWALPW